MIWFYKQVVLVLLVLVVWAGVVEGRACCAKQGAEEGRGGEVVLCAVDEGSKAGSETAEQEISGALDELLDRVEKRGASLKSLQGKMYFEQELMLVEVKEIRHGRIVYLSEKDVVQFRIHFDDWQQLDLEEEEPAPPVKQDLDYVFDGRWFSKRDARNKMIQRWEVSKSPRDKEAFRLGKGPFPLPFAVRKQDVLAEFEVELKEVDPNGPANSDHVVLIPKKGSTYAQEYVRLELWVDRVTAVPVKMRFEKEGFDVTTVVWSGLSLDRKISGEKFVVEPPDGSWTVEVTPLEEKAEVGGS